MYDPVYGPGIPATDPALYASRDTTLQQTGLYLQEQAKLDNWVVTLGGRYDWVRNETIDRLAGTTPKSNNEAFTWGAALLYHATNGVAPYFSYSESFFPLSDINPATGAPFAPETGQQYEAGIKYQLTGMWALLTAATFDITRQNYLTYDNTFFPRQTGEVRSRGLEFEATAEVVEGFDLIAAYAWLPEFKIIESAASEEVGKRDPLVPKHTASFWMHYRFRYGPLAGFGFGGGCATLARALAT